ncbi:CHAT domain-containing protein [Parasphingorhabdus sp.]|uniref:CHAT domain-containing tetratricopeptide repeat protein n=1 Tax=Parasphingorhabdus sp. TaxID=2709688 RepID=UPI00326772E7
MLKLVNFNIRFAILLFVGGMLIPLEPLKSQTRLQTEFAEKRAEIARYNAMRDYETALRLAQQLSVAVAKEQGTSGIDYARAIQILGFAQEYAGQIEAAELSLKRSVNILTAVLGADDSNSLLFRNSLIVFYMRQKNYEVAIPAALRLQKDQLRVLPADDPSVIGTLHNLATAYDHMKQDQQAVEIYSRLISLHGRKFGPDHPRVLDYRFHQARVLQRSGMADRTIQEYRKLFADHLRLFGSQDERTLLISARYADALAAHGKEAESRQQFQKLISRLKIAKGQTHPQTIGAITRYAAFLTRYSRFSEAATMLSTSYDTAGSQTGYDRAARWRIDSAFGHLYFSWGRYLDAEQAFRRAIDGYARGSEGQESQQFALLNGLASVLFKQGRYTESVSLFGRLIDLMDEARASAIAVNIDVHGVRRNLAIAYRNLGQLKHAEDVIQQQLGDPALDHPTKILMKIGSLKELASIRYVQGKYEESGKILTYALQLAEKDQTVGDQTVENLVDNLISAMISSGHGAKAQPFLRQLYFDKSDRLGMSHPDSIALGINYTRLLLELDDKTDDAMMRAEGSLHAIFSSVAEVYYSPDPQSQFLTKRRYDHRPAYFNMIEASWRTVNRSPNTYSYTMPKAFSAIQNAMVDNTNIAIAQMTARKSAGRANSVLERIIEKRLVTLDQLKEVQRKRDDLLGKTDAGTASVAARLTQEQDRLNRDYSRLTSELQRGFPDYFSLVRPLPVNLQDTRKLLKNDEAVLLLVPTDFGTHVMAVTNDGDGLKWHRSDLKAVEIERIVSGLRKSLDQKTDPIFGEYDLPFDRSASYGLYEALIQPVADRLAGRKHVYFAATGALTSLPFSVLVTSPPRGDDYDPEALRNTHWFSDQHALIQIPSLQSLQLLRSLQARKSKTENRAKRPLDGFGDPVLAPVEGDGSTTDNSNGSFKDVFVRGARRANGTGIVDVSSLRKLSSLPGTAKELEDLRENLGAPASAVRLQSAATETAVRSADLSNSRIVAFATHGLLAGEITGTAEPGLVFTPPVSPSENDDGLLTTSEIAALNINADWVILSACNTASGDGKGAPGLSGLARAFFFAGAESLLASHWPVRDDVASTITVETIKLQQSDAKLSRAEAFQQAMLNIRNSQDDPSKSHPAAWAPFTLIGDR